MLGKRVYQEIVNCRIPLGKPRSMGRSSPRMMCSVYHNFKVADSVHYGWITPKICAPKYTRRYVEAQVHISAVWCETAQ